jgi:hypothetical protein
MPFKTQEKKQMKAATKKPALKLHVALMGTVIAMLGVATAPALASKITVHTASSYGAKVQVGSVVKVGPIAPALLPACDTQPVATVTASAASVNQAPFINTGVVDSVASSTATSSTASSDVLGVNLLGGVITANEIKAVSTSSVSGKVFSFSAVGSEFVNLSVLGIPISVNPAPNTTIELPGIGSVILNEQSTATSSDMSTLTVKMIDIHVTLPNLLGYPVGTQIIVSEALSEIKSVGSPAVVGGYAYAPQLIAGPVTSGPLVDVIIPCFGTYGAVKTDTVVSTSLPGVLSTGTVTVTGEGNVNSSGANSQATTTTASLNLLSGLVSATVIKATASGTTSDGETFDFTGGTTFGGISVAGHPEITVNIAPNTKISIPGLGTLYLNKINKYSDKIKVVPVQLVVTTTNTLGLAVGAQVTIGAAEAQLHSAAIP